MCAWRKLYSLFFFWGSVLSAVADPVAVGQKLEFVENRGQWDARARYVAELPAGRLFVEPGGLTYAFVDAALLNHHQAAAPKTGSAAPAPTDQIRAHALRVRFAGAAAQVALAATEPTSEVRNYFYGNDPAKWAAAVPGFRQLRYAGLWPGIDARLYENRDQKLEYDFELAPGADPARIQLRYEGADGLALQPDGSLQVRTSLGALTELAPQAWQTDARGQRRVVACQYVVRGNAVSFRLGTYDHQRPLTIDPTIVFSTYTGSTADNWGFTATYDAQGNLYSGGIAFGLGYPTTTGAFQTNFGSLVDIALIKYNTATTGAAARVWATYIGGTGHEYPHSLVVNSQNELLLLGSTSSGNYPTTATAYDRTFNGGTSITPIPSNTLGNGSDIVVTHLSANGGQLLGSTLLGGSGNDGLLNPAAPDRLTLNYGDAFRGDILTDAAGNVYIASCTASPDFPVANGFNGTYKGGATDAVVCKLTPDLSKLVWSSLLGGNGSDGAYSLQLDDAGNIYVAGGTYSTDLPVPATALNARNQGRQDGFVARISNDGTQLLQATYLGTGSYDQAYILQLDAEGSVYVLGQSLGSYPVTPGHYSNANAHQFIHKLNPALTTTLFSTVIGSGQPTLDFSPTAFLVDQCNRIYLTGWGGGPNAAYYSNGFVTRLPLTGNALRSTTNGSDFYLMQLSADAMALSYATFFGEVNGANHVDGGTSRFDPRGIVYQAVCACGDGISFPIPPGAGTYSPTAGTYNCNNAAFKFNFDTYTVNAGPDQQVCTSEAAYPLYGSPAGGTWTGPGVSGSVASGFVFNAASLALGQYQLTYTVTGQGTCGGTATTRVTTVETPTVTFVPLARTTYCQNDSPPAPLILQATPAGGQFSGPAVNGNVFSPGNLSAGTHTLTYTYTQGRCQASATQQVTVTDANAGADFTTCTSAAPTQLGGTPAGGTWSGPGVSGSVATGFSFTPTPALAGTQELTYTVNGCASTTQATVLLSVPPVIPSYPEFCAANTTPVPLPTSLGWSGPGVSYSSASPQGYYFSPALAGVGTHALVYFGGNGYCDVQGEGVIQMRVRAAPASVVLPDTLLCPGSTQTIRLRAAPAGGTWSGSGVTADGRFTPPAGFAGFITATYTYSDGPCTATTTRRIGVAPLPVFAPVGQPTACPQDREAPLLVRFSGIGGPATWDFGDGTQATGTTVEHTYATPGRYQPKVIMRFNQDKCSTEATLPAIDVILHQDAPNIITPNGDGLNDVFVVSLTCPQRLQIFSRWGTKVYESAAYQNDWNGGQQPNGTYYYYLHMTDGSTRKGWLQVQR